MPRNTTQGSCWGWWCEGTSTLCEQSGNITADVCASHLDNSIQKLFKLQSVPAFLSKLYMQHIDRESLSSTHALSPITYMQLWKRYCIPFFGCRIKIKCRSYQIIACRYDTRSTAYTLRLCLTVHLEGKKNKKMTWIECHTIKNVVYYGKCWKGSK